MIDPPLRDYLETLSLREAPGRLRRDRACKLCGDTAPYFDSVDFHRSCDDQPFEPSHLMVPYFRCRRCELLFTDFCDGWGAPDFARFIYNDDYVIVDGEYTGVRPRRTADFQMRFLAGAEQARILDYGSGSGLFGEAMIERGFPNVESYDPFSSDVRPNGTFDIVTCFDVIEHSPDPVGTLGDILSYTASDGIALIGQTLQPIDIEQQRGAWWYLAPRNGHVTTYSIETIRLYADRQGLLYDDFPDLFALSRPERSDLSQTIIARGDPKRRWLDLRAPDPALTDLSDWHDAEREGGTAWRWTAEAEAHLGAHVFPAGQTRVSIPYSHLLDKGILTGSFISAGTQRSPVIARDGKLTAAFHFPDQRVRHVTLHTPPPVSPRSLGGAPDDRLIGIAIQC